VELTLQIFQRSVGVSPDLMRADKLVVQVALVSNETLLCSVLALAFWVASRSMARVTGWPLGQTTLEILMVSM
jgi:hypothetical protein